MSKLSIIGLGKLGTPLLSVLASKGHNVWGIDKNSKAIKAINHGQSPVSEPDVEELFRKYSEKFHASTEYKEAILNTDITFIIVPTPSTPDGNFSSKFLVSAVVEMGQTLRIKAGYHLVVIMSTVTPQTLEKDIIPALEKASGKICGRDFGVCYNPLFIALGSVVRNILFPDFILIGQSDSRSGELLEKFYRSVVDRTIPIRRMNIVSAELVKISINAFITTKISFANTLGAICENVNGAVIDDVTRAVGLDSRIGSKYLSAGLGFGGPCFPRDNSAFAWTARNNKALSSIAFATDEINKIQPRRVISRIESAGPDIQSVAVLGLSYKTKTPVVEQSHGLEIARIFSELGKNVKAYDPLVDRSVIKEAKINPCDSVSQCIENADAIIIALPYEEFMLTRKQIESANAPVVFDSWRIMSPEILKGHGTYLAPGVPDKPIYNFNKMRNEKAVICGAGGFIGGHLVAYLIKKGFRNIRAVDIKPLEQWFQKYDQVENLQLDLRRSADCHKALKKADYVYNLAADMGGIGFLENNKALCMLNVLINTQLLVAAKESGVKRYFYSSSACVYSTDKQKSSDVTPLSEEDIYPIMPEHGYGWEKLFSEIMCRRFMEDFNLETRVARFHNVYGAHGAYKGGREKAPSAICRKVAEAKISGNHEIEIWGDGRQTRSFTYIDDCVKGIYEIMLSDIKEPINLGSSEMVTIDQMVDMVEDIAGVKLTRKYNLTAAKGVNGRNSDNTMIKSLLGWEPNTKLKDGLEKTYNWIYKDLHGKTGNGIKHKIKAKHNGQSQNLKPRIYGRL